eukprot:8224730-Lingulodinium_polyedra.AAC.1
MEIGMQSPFENKRLTLGVSNQGAGPISASIICLGRSPVWSFDLFSHVGSDVAPRGPGRHVLG